MKTLVAACAAACALVLGNVPAVRAQQAAPPGAAAEIGALMKAGQYADALRRADARLKDNPRDAQVRFMRGVILTEQGKPVEAAAVFEALTQEFPELPEPYNNLAVLQAAQGRHAAAHRLLQQALAAQPNYVTAHENLGDLYLSMSEAAYAKALGLDATQRLAKAKLELVRELSARVRALR
jgi:Flp pilus assembly protein TadD